MTSFASLGLSDSLVRAVREKGYENATPIQAQAIPVVLQGCDVLAAAQTGTGKTAGFTLPLLQRLSASGVSDATRPVRALVLTPTRELAAQVGENVEEYSRHLSLRSTVVFGGVGINPQIERLRRGVDVLVATPGRLLDLHGQRALDLSRIEILVLDEADRMLDMGFIHDIRRVLKLLPAHRQNLLFSATFSDEIRQLAKGLLRDPVSIEVAPRNTTAAKVEQSVYQVEKADKQEILSYLIQRGGWEQVLVFTRTKHGANKLSQQLERDGITAAAIHGNKSQNARTRALADFKSGEIRVLVATDIAARGLDIEQLPHVVNYELPNVPEDYVHRIGRTGRAGASGQAISLVSSDERKLLVDIERLLKRKLPVEVAPDFVPREKKPAPVAAEIGWREAAPPRGQRRPSQPRSQAATNSQRGAQGQRNSNGQNGSREQGAANGANQARRSRPAHAGSGHPRSTTQGNGNNGGGQRRGGGQQRRRGAGVAE